MSHFCVGERVVYSGHGLMDVKAEIRMGQRVLVLRSPRSQAEIFIPTEEASAKLRYPLSKEAARCALEMLYSTGEPELAPESAWNEQLGALHRYYLTPHAPSAEERELVQTLEQSVVAELEYVLGMAAGELVEELHARHSRFR